MGNRDRGRSIGSLWELHGPFQHHSSDVVSVPVASCGGRMPEWRVPGVGTSALCLSCLFRDRHCTMVAWCFMSMFCLVLRLHGA